VWQSEAVVIRGALREQGAHGEMRALDEIASGRRGTSAPTQLTRLAIEMRDHGMSEAAAMERLTRVAQQITALVYHDAA
jgi:hypothetical protein